MEHDYITSVQAFALGGANHANAVDGQRWMVPENRADEEYFRVHRDDPDTGLFLSHPMLHRGALAMQNSCVMDPRPPQPSATPAELPDEAAIARALAAVSVDQWNDLWGTVDAVAAGQTHATWAGGGVVDR